MAAGHKLPGLLRAVIGFSDTCCLMVVASRFCWWLTEAESVRLRMKMTAPPGLFEVK
jgi:hypothetical protein